MLGIGGFGFLMVGTTQTKRSASLLDAFDVEEDAFWQVVSDDVLIYAIFDELNIPRNNFTSKSYALMLNKILSINDLPIDADILPDLLLNSEFLIGNEDLKITIGQYLDLSILYLLYKVYTGTILGEGLDFSTLLLPSFSSLHVIPSNFLYFFENIYKNLRDYGIEPPTYSFDYETLGVNYTSQFWGLNATNNLITTQMMPKERNYSIGLQFDLLDNNSQCVLYSKNLDKSNYSGEVSYDFYASTDNNSFYYLQYDVLGDPFMSNGVLLNSNDTQFGFLESKYKWFDNGLIQNWILNDNENSFYPLANMSLNAWNHVKLTYGTNYTQNNTVEFNGINYSIPFYISDPNYAFQITNYRFGLLGNNAGRAYLDSIRFLYTSNNPANTSSILTQGILSFFDDFPIDELLKVLSIYNLMLLPKILNFNAFYDLLIFLMDYIDKLIGTYAGTVSFKSVFRSMIRNEPHKFSIYFNNTMLEEIISLFLPQNSSPQLLFPEGKATWYFETSWDKDIMILNASHIVINYTDIGANREIGLKLITTRSDRGYEDGYYYYNATYFESNISTPILRPYVRHVSMLNNDSYAQRIPKEWDLFNFEDLTGLFLNELDTTPLINSYAQAHVPEIALAIVGIVGASAGLSFGLNGLFNAIMKRRKKVELK